MCKLLIKKFEILLFLFGFFAESRGMEENENPKEELKIEKFWRIKNCQYQYEYKCPFIGDAGVGKTQILSKFFINSFKDDYKETLGSKFSAIVYEAFLNNNRKTFIRFKLYDTIAKKECRSFTLSGCESSHILFFVYDVTNRESFQNIAIWLDEVKKKAPEDAKFVLIGNKIDLKEVRQVLPEEGQKFADDNGMEFIEVSAKDGTNLGYTEIENAAGTNNGLENILKDFNEEYLKKQPVQQVIYPVVVQPEQPVIIQEENDNSCCQQCYPDDCCK